MYLSITTSIPREPPGKTTSRSSGEIRYIIEQLIFGNLSLHGRWPVIGSRRSNRCWRWTALATETRDVGTSLWTTRCFARSRLPAFRHALHRGQVDATKSHARVLPEYLHQNIRHTKYRCHRRRLVISQSLRTQQALRVPKYLSRSRGIQERRAKVICQNINEIMINKKLFN